MSFARAISGLLCFTVCVATYEFGQSSALTGVSGDLGTNMYRGTQAAFDMANRAGGIYGRQLNLISLDDQYNPGPAVNNTLQLIDVNHVIAMLSSSGTPTTLAVLNVTKPRRVPILAPFTGSRALRIPVNRYVINTRAGYDEEVYAFVKYCVSRSITLFSIFYQNDAYGTAGLSALNIALTNLNLKILSYGTFERNDVASVNMTGIQSAGITPQAIIMIGTAQPLARLVSLIEANSTWNNVLLHSVSFLGSEEFLDQLHVYNVSSSFVLKNVFVTQVFPIPQTLGELAANGITYNPDRRQLLVDFAYAMNLSFPGEELTFGALEGFVGGSLVKQVLQDMGPFDTTNRDLDPYLAKENTSVAEFNITDGRTLSAWREFFLDTLFGRTYFQIGGLRLGPYAENITCPANYVSCFQPVTPPCTQGMQNVFLTQPDLANDKYVELFDWRVESTTCYEHSQLNDAKVSPIVFGQTAALTGPTAHMGINMREGILAAFNRVNLSPSKGIHGRPLLLVSMDDGYEVNQAVTNAKKLVNMSVFAVVGSTGTPTSTATLPVIVGAGIPFIGPFTGARVLRNNSLVVNVRAQYDDECAGMVEYLLSKGLTNISLLRQDDSYGAAGENGLKLALGYHKRKLHSVASYPHLTTDVAEAFQNFTRDGVPEAMVFFSTAGPAAELMRLAETDPRWDNVTYIAVSFVVLEDFRAKVQSVAPTTLVDKRVLMSAVVPPLSVNSPATSTYLDALTMYNPSIVPTFGSFEGFLVGQMLVNLLFHSPEISVESVMEELYADRTVNVGELVFGPYTTNEDNNTCNLGLRTVYVMQLDNNSDVQLLHSLRVRPTDPNQADCGALTIYDPAFKCPAGYMKTFTDSDSMAFQCEVCLNKYGCDIPVYEPNATLRDAMLGLNIIGALITVIFIAVILWFRKTVTIRAVSPPFCLLILFGALSAYAAIFVLYPGITPNVCMAQIYLLNTSFCFIFGSLFAKVFRVTQIFRPRKRKTLRVMKIKDVMLFGGVGLIWVAEMIYTIVWHYQSPLEPVLVLTTEYSAYTCRASLSTFGIANILANGGFLTYGILLSFQSRKIPTVFNEAKFVAITLYNTLIVGAIFILACYNLATNNDQDFMYKSLAVFIVITADVLFLIGSKFPSLYREVLLKNPPKFKNESSSSTHTGTGTGTETSAQAKNSKRVSRDGAAEMSKLPSPPHSHNGDDHSARSKVTTEDLSRRTVGADETSRKPTVSVSLGQQPGTPTVPEIIIDPPQ